MKLNKIKEMSSPELEKELNIEKYKKVEIEERQQEVMLLMKENSDFKQ